RQGSPGELLEDLVAALRPGETVPDRGVPPGSTASAKTLSRVGQKVVPPTVTQEAGPEALTPLRSPRSRRRWWIAGSAAGLLVAGALAGWLLWPCNSGATAPGVTANE